jgi:hypothetical protein
VSKCNLISWHGKCWVKTLKGCYSAKYECNSAERPINQTLLPMKQGCRVPASTNFSYTFPTLSLVCHISTSTSGSTRVHFLILALSSAAPTTNHLCARQTTTSPQKRRAITPRRVINTTCHSSQRTQERKQKRIEFLQVYMT